MAKIIDLVNQQENCDIFKDKKFVSHNERIYEKVINERRKNYKRKNLET